MTGRRPRKLIGVISFMSAGGAPLALMRLARQLRSRGHEVEVWFLYEEDPVYAQEPFVRVFARKPKLSLTEYVGTFWRLVAALKAAKPDAVLGFLPLGMVFGLTAAALAGVPLRVASHRSPGSSYGRVMRKLDRMLGATTVYDRIVCVSGAVMASFAAYPEAYRRKLSVIHNGIEWAPSRLSREEARKALGLPADGFIAVAVGRLKAQKNYALLLDAIAGVEDVRLVIAGDGPLQPQLEAQAAALGVAGRVTFLGAMSRSQVQDLLRAADAFVQSSLYEGQSNAVLEAMHQGVPIIVSDIPEQRETVADETTGEVGGLLAPLGDTAAWAEALKRIRDDADLRHALSRTAQALVARKFTLTRMVDSFEQAISSQS